jgi:hypothetical protein
MNHLKIFIIPVLMLADYFLTVVGARMSEKKYRQHFKISSYELNPIFQRQIAQKRWFSAKHSAGVLVVTAFCWLWANNWNELAENNEVLFGFFAGLFTTIIGAHLANIFTFFYLIKNPTEVSGEIVLHHCYTLSTTSFRYLIVLLPLILIGIFSGSPFVYGAISSVGTLIFLHAIWYVKAKKSKSKTI